MGLQNMNLTFKLLTSAEEKITFAEFEYGRVGVSELDEIISVEFIASPKSSIFQLFPSD